MAHLSDKEVPDYETLQKMSQRFPTLDPLSMTSFIQLQVVSDELVRGITENLEFYHLTKGKLILLIQLYDMDVLCPQERSPAELAEIMKVSRATVTGLLDGLERIGLVTRSLNSEDRRKLTVTLTPKGLSLLGRILPENFERIQELMNGLSTDEKKELLKLIGKLSNHLNAVTPESGNST